MKKTLKKKHVLGGLMASILLAVFLKGFSLATLIAILFLAPLAILVMNTLCTDEY